jgi:hypothetical protein
MRKEMPMGFWGWVAVAAGVVVVWLAIVTGPSAVRYLKIKNM